MRTRNESVALAILMAIAMSQQPQVKAPVSPPQGTVNPQTEEAKQRALKAAADKRERRKLKYQLQKRTQGDGNVKS